jgi:exodeoxyribonuclease VII small subunit
MTESKKKGAAAPAPESATYKAMLTEVEAIVREVAAPEVDLDDMVSKVERGYHLIKAMRTRLGTTKQQVEQLRLDFE